MNGDLIAEKEYKETIDSGIKTWRWLKSLFKKGNEELNDDEFIKTLLEEAKDKTEEIDKIESDFNKDMLKTAEMVNDKANEKSKEMENQNIANPSKKIDEKPLENTNIKDGKELVQDSFIKDFGDTYKETLSQAKPKIEKEIIIDERSGVEMNTEMRTMLEKDGFYQWNYFSAKKEYMQYDKQQGIVQSKESFIKEFKQYAQNSMTADEMRVLIALSNSKNSKLTPEHKLLIKDCLNIAQKDNKNFQFLSEGHKAIIRANNNQMLGTQSIKDFLSFANTPKNKMDKLDNTILNSCKESCVKSIIANNKNLPQATITKLTALINPALAKTMEAGANIGRTLTK